MSVADQFARRLAWDACYNVRDLGGHVTGAGGRTRWRAVVRSDTLCRLTAAGRAALVAYGVRTVIDLRALEEVQQEPHPFGHLTAAGAWPRYLNLPLEEGSNAAGTAALKAAESMEGAYRAILDHFRPNMAAIVRAVAQAPDGGVLVHCHAGKDRTGLVVAALLSLAGVPAATIAADYALSTAYLRPFYDELLRTIDDPEERARWERVMPAPPERMLATLAHLDRRYGGVEPYLLGADVSEADVERIRGRLLG